MEIDLSKQRKLDADPKAIQQTSFTGNLSRAEGAKMFSIPISFIFFKSNS